MYRFIFNLLRQKGADSNHYFSAHAFRGFFMKYMANLNPSLISVLHDNNNQIRPYSISVKHFREDASIKFLLTIFTQEISQELLQQLLSIKEMKIIIQNRALLLLNVQFEKIYPDKFLKSARRLKKFKIQFLRPTYFNMMGRSFTMRLPQVEYIFANLTNIWNSFAPVGCNLPKDDFLKYVIDNVYISSCELRTKALYLGKNKPEIGCSGWAIYLVNNPTNSYCIWLDTLLCLAEFTNIGANRTAGAGVIKYIPLEFDDEN